MTLLLLENQYPGINAHLQSYLQQEPGGWEMFHASHIIHIAESINQHLPPGYRVKPEKSIQIREFHSDTGEPTLMKKRPRPDVSIVTTAVAKQSSAGGILEGTSPVLVLSAEDVLNDDPAIYFTSLSIYEITQDKQPGKTVAWLELLSPTNKPGGSGAIQYQEKRTAALRGGLVLVEIDYLHETPPVIAKLASYPDNEEQAYPYTIVVTDPRPDLPTGKAHIYGCGVDDAVPIVKIPLSGNDALILDFGSIYDRTYTSLDVYSDNVDYEQNPINFEHYHAADQDKIRARMTIIQLAYQQNQLPELPTE